MNPNLSDLLLCPLSEVVAELERSLEREGARGGILSFDTEVSVVFWIGHPELEIGGVYEAGSGSRTIVDLTRAGGHTTGAFTVRTDSMTFWVVDPRLARAVQLLAGVL